MRSLTYNISPKYMIKKINLIKITIIHFKVYFVFILEDYF